MGMTLAEKILARAAGCEHVSPDQIVIARVDLAMSHENADLVRKSFLEIGVGRVWDPSKIVIIFDHRVPAESEKTATTRSSSYSTIACRPNPKRPPPRIRQSVNLWPLRASSTSMMSAAAASVI